MKLAKKLLILTLMAAILTTAAINSQKPHSEVTLITGTETTDYEDHDIKDKQPHSIHTIKAV